MNKVSVVLGVVAIILALLGIGVGVYSINSQPVIVYASSSVLFTDYDGVKESERVFQEKVKVWKSNLDTLEQDIDSYIDSYKKNLATMNESQRKETEAFISKRQQEYFRYKQTVEENIEQEDLKMTRSVVNQMNSWIAEYGEQNGFDVIIGGTETGNLLYAPKQMDITDDLVEFLNTKYRGD